MAYCNDSTTYLYQTEYWCPGPIEICEGFVNRRGVNIGKSPSYVSLVSCSLSVLGSLLIVFAYWKWKDIRTGSRSIVTYLAIADFFTAAGYIVAGVNYLQHYGQAEATPECVTFQQICEMQSFITTWSSMSSFAWTSILAIYLYLTIVRQRNDLAARLIPIGHVVAWVLPFFIVYPLLCTGHLGYSLVATSNWCYVRGSPTHEQPVSFHGHIPLDITLFVLVAGKCWDILTNIIVLVFYGLIKSYLRKETFRNRNILSERLVQTTREVDRKLTFVPVLFILLRLWGTIQFVYALIVSKWMECACVSKDLWMGFFVLGILQAIGDGGQGWGNALFYIFGFSVVRKRMFGWMWVGLKSFYLCLCVRRESDFETKYRSIQKPQKPATKPLAISTWHWLKDDSRSPTFDTVDGGRLVFESPKKTRYTPPRRTPSGKRRRDSYVEY